MLVFQKIDEIAIFVTDSIETPGSSDRRTPPQKRKREDLHHILLGKEILRVEAETKKLKIEQEKLELEKQKLALEITLLQRQITPRIFEEGGRSFTMLP